MRIIPIVVFNYSSGRAVTVSPNGWTSDEIGLHWLQKVFIPETIGWKTGRYCLLILDGHGSHLTPDFDKVCCENDIIPVCMPPHSSNYCQPLDVSCFAPLKKAYGDLVQKQMWNGFNHIDKLDFLEAYPDARKQAFAPTTIKNGFRATGLVPFDPEEVLKRFTIQLKCYRPTCISLRGTKWQNIDRVPAQGDSESDENRDSPERDIVNPHSED